jgi:hypothetical protein
VIGFEQLKQIATLMRKKNNEKEEKLEKMFT